VCPVICFVFNLKANCVDEEVFFEKLKLK
jgi:hypothetical protein